MFNWALYKKEMKSNLKMVLIFMAVLSLYTTVITTMYDPEAMKSLDAFSETLPQIMEAVGMKPGSTTMIGFLATYLYGFILIVIPMIYSILCANKLVAKYVDNTSMSTLLAAPIKRHTIILTQICVLLTGIIILVSYVTILQISISHARFPGELDVNKLLILNSCLLILHVFIGSICFICSTIASSTGSSIGWGAGIPALMMILQMLGNVGGDAEWVKNFTFFTLFTPMDIIEASREALINVGILGAGALILLFASVEIFIAKDLNV